VTRLINWAIAAVLVSIACALIFHHIGRSSLLGDESIYAEVSREAAHNHRAWPLTYLGRNFVDKPPLTLWAGAAVYRAFGVSETTTRMSAAVFALATILLVVFAGIRLFGPGAGLLSGLFLLCTRYFIFMHGARAGVPDSALVFFIGAALLLHLELRDSPFPGRRWSAAVGTGMLTGAAILTKSVVGLLVVFVLAAFEGVCALRGRRLPEIGKRTVVIVSIAFAFQLGWFIAVSRATGGGAWAFFHRDIWERFSTGLDPGHLRPGLYGFTLWFDFGKGLILLPTAGVLACLDRRAGREAAYEKVLFLSVWVSMVLLMMEPSVSKLPWYIYPAYPAIALLLGFAADRILFHSRGALRLASAVVFAVLAVFIGKHVRRNFETADRKVVRTDADALARYLAASPRLVACRDPRLLSIREWDMFYLGWIRRPAPTGEPMGASPCAIVLTGAPGTYIDADRFPARVRLFKKYSSEEQPLYAVSVRSDFPRRLFD
jgi:4-amino-4-deoxy-L-arabinose transferase-like glycosyltransferase